MTKKKTPTPIENSIVIVKGKPSERYQKRMRYIYGRLRRLRVLLRVLNQCTREVVAETEEGNDALFGLLRDKRLEWRALQIEALRGITRHVLPLDVSLVCLDLLRTSKEWRLPLHPALDEISRHELAQLQQRARAYLGTRVSDVGKKV